MDTYLYFDYVRWVHGRSPAVHILVHVPDHTGDDLAIAHVGAIQGQRAAPHFMAKSQPRAQMIIPCVMVLASRS